MELPESFLRRVAGQLGGEYDAFLAAMAGAAPTSVRLNPRKGGGVELDFEGAVAWAAGGRYLRERPLFTADPLLHAGAYYVQEASSMFLERLWAKAIAAAQNGENRPLAVLDLCAAPGGKSTHAAALLPEDSLLVCNEIVPNRCQILQENVQKWGLGNVVVTQHNPQQLAEHLPQFFDIILIDAPCSGEGMFRKDPAAAEHWSPANVEKCAARQREILQSAWSMLRPNGLIIYSTCTYNREENEENLAWWLKQVAAASLPRLEDLGADKGVEIIDYEGVVGYRFWPHRHKGEGFFAACLRKLDDDGGETQLKVKDKHWTWQGRRQTAHLAGLLHDTERWRWVLHRDEWRAFDATWEAVYPYLYNRLRVAYAGLSVVEQLRQELKPQPALALHWAYAGEAYAACEVDLRTAQAFLRLDNFVLADAPRGWLLLTYKGCGLGWVKNLGDRLNNYYPKHWRIRMELPDELG